MQAKHTKKGRPRRYTAARRIGAYVEADVVEKFHDYARVHGLTLNEFMTRACVAYIEAGLRGQSTPPDAAQPRPRSPLPVAIPRVAGSPMTPALTNAELYAILDDEDAERFRRLSGH